MYDVVFSSFFEHSEPASGGLTASGHVRRMAGVDPSPRGLHLLITSGRKRRPVPHLATPGASWQPTAAAPPVNATRANGVVRGGGPAAGPPIPVTGTPVIGLQMLDRQQLDSIIRR